MRSLLHYRPSSGLCRLQQQYSAAAPQPAPRVFSEADVTKAQEEITHDYQNKGFEVEQVSLIKDADRHRPASSRSGGLRA